jgi:hypothetical protein
MFDLEDYQFKDDWEDWTKHKLHGLLATGVMENVALLPSSLWGSVLLPSEPLYNHLP